MNSNDCKTQTNFIESKEKKREKVRNELQLVVLTLTLIHITAVFEFINQISFSCRVFVSLSSRLQLMLLVFRFRLAHSITLANILFFVV